MKKSKLSVVLATNTEENNIGSCLESVKEIADEIVVVDEYSKDKTAEIAKRHGAKVYKYQHRKNFHETKQKAIEKATGDWILQLDADERVTPELAEEIKLVISMGNDKLIKYEVKDKKKRKLFNRHFSLIEKREGKLGEKTGEVAALFIARKNFFLGKPLRYAGVYPDGVIRLVKKGKAKLPAKSVHELMEVKGEIVWMENDLEHYESPTLMRYIKRANRYTNLHAKRLANLKTPKNLVYLIIYTVVKPTGVFLNLLIRHKGILDGTRGFLWSLFSAWHFPIAYYKYWVSK